MTLDHVGLQVSQLERSTAFYDALFEPLGLARRAEVQGWRGYGVRRERVSFWIGVAAEPPRATHVAFEVATRAAVERFHDAACAIGARIRSAPALRPEYHEHFYSAMAFDPDGHNIEVVCHAAP